MSIHSGIVGYPLKKDTNDIQPPGGVMADGGWFPLCQNQNASMSFVDGREWIFRFNIWYPTQIKALGVAITAAAAGSTPRLHMGIRGMLMNGWPGPLLVEGVTTDILGTGSKWVPAFIDLQPGSYCACIMATGWSVTAPQARSGTGGGDVYSIPGTILAIIPQSYSAALPSGGNPGYGAAFRTSGSAGLTQSGDVRDWSVNTQPPAMYAQAEPIYG